MNECSVLAALLTTVPGVGGACRNHRDPRDPGSGRTSRPPRGPRGPASTAHSLGSLQREQWIGRHTPDTDTEAAAEGTRKSCPRPAFLCRLPALVHPPTHTPGPRHPLTRSATVPPALCPPALGLVAPGW